MHGTTSRIAMAALLTALACGSYALAAQPETPPANDDAAAAPDTLDGTSVGIRHGTEEPAVSRGPEGGNTTGVDGFLSMQGFDSALAGDLIGSVVHSRDHDAIGQIDDLVIGRDGRVEGYVIGIGGFLGLGERRVAVRPETLRMAPEPNGRVGLVLDMDPETLEAAPDFKSLAEQILERELDAELRAMERESATRTDPPPVSGQQ